MDSYEEKIKLLAEMVAFSVVDGKLHPREIQFLSIVATELRIPPDALDQLFHQEFDKPIIQSELQRIQQFYRLALLMHCDGVLHEREKKAIHEIGINMGLNPFAMRRVLKAMERSPTRILPPQFIVQVFQEQHN
jgi:uncharacterized tellurite resistance protein B-like protein